jgi:hypothetical protein
MLRAMSPGVYIAIGIILGAGLSILIGNGFIGIGLGLAIGVALYYGTRALSMRRRP